MPINVDRILALIGVLLSIPGTVSLFYSGQATAGILVILVMALLCIIWYFNSKQSFTIMNVAKTLTLHDTKGDKATLVRHQKTRTNHNGLTEFWCSRSISADGSIKNILIDGKEPFQIETDAGDIQVCMRFKSPKKAGAEFDFVLSYELENAFHRTTEALVHVIESETKKLKLVVEFPEGRQPRVARTILRYGGNPHKELDPPILLGKKIEAEIKRPRLGADYCVEWEW